MIYKVDGNPQLHVTGACTRTSLNGRHFKKTKVFDQVVYAMVPRPPFLKLVLRKIKIMTDGRSVDVVSGNFS